MTEIVLHQRLGARIEGEGSAKMVLKLAIFRAIEKEGSTPEEVFDLVMAQPEIACQELAAHQFFLAIVSLLDAGFISASVRGVASA